MRSCGKFLFVLVWALGGALAFAANPDRPVVGPGATRDDVIKAYGWPNGQSHSGTKEILTYAQGEVVLENGRVERVNFSPDIPWQAPKPRPGPPTASTRKVPDTPVDFWVTNYEAALTEAARRGSRILALFSGSDWSPPSRQFHDEVEFHPDFVNAFAGDFVFLKLDFPRGNPVPVKVSDQNLKLRDRYDVTTYPTLLVLSGAGDLLARVDLAKFTEGTYRERVINAVREADNATAGAKPAPALDKAAVRAITPAPPHPTTAATPPSTGPTDAPTAPIMLTASKLIAGALIAGAILVGATLWLVWRKRRVAETNVPVLEMADRIDAAAGGMPTHAEMSGWTREKMVAITAALAEFDGFTAHIRPADSDVDIELRKRGDSKPRVLVCCSPGAAGVVPTRRLRELFATLAAEGVETGWFVSPAGFSNDGRAYAAAHRIMLVGSESLHNMMREVPTVSLPTLLARG